MLSRFVIAFLPRNNCHLNSWLQSPSTVILENGIETCIILYMKRIASPGSMHDTRCLGLVHWDNPEAWCGVGGGGGRLCLGTHVHPWWIRVHVWQNQYSIVK